MRGILLAVVLMASVPFSAAAAEKRCGWLSNPTPQNLWLIDKDATWSITSQGEAAGKDAEGVDKVPDFDTKQYVDQGNGHGYGCACLSVETSRKDQRITRVMSGEILPLAKCKNDKSLPSPE